MIRVPADDCISVAQFLGTDQSLRFRKVVSSADELWNQGNQGNEAAANVAALKEAAWWVLAWPACSSRFGLQRPDGF